MEYIHQVQNKKMDDDLKSMISDIQSELSNTDNIENILDMIDDYKCSSNIENKTTDDIMKEIINVLNVHTIPNTDTVSRKLIEYVYIDEICDIQKGRHIRWIRITPGAKLTLTNGGVIMDVKFTDNGTQILCKNKGNMFIQYKFDDCISFQKMSNQEQIIIMANSSIDSSV